MKSETRLCVAYIVSRMVNGGESSSVYSVLDASWHQFSGLVTSTRIQVYDHRRATHVTGSRGGTGMILYDHAANTHLSFFISGETFSGVDLTSHHLFSGSVTQWSVMILDEEDSLTHHFDI